MSRGLLIVNVMDAQSAKPVGGALVGLGALRSKGEGGLLQIFKETGAPWVNPHIVTGQDGMAVFSFSWDETDLGATTCDVEYKINVSPAPPYRSFVSQLGILALVVDLANVYSGRLPSFKSPSSVVTALLKAYLKYIQSKVPLPQSLGLKAGRPSPEYYGLIGVAQARV